MPGALPVFSESDSYNFPVSGGFELGTPVVIDVARISGIFWSSQAFVTDASLLADARNNC